MSTVTFAPQVSQVSGIVSGVSAELNKAERKFRMLILETSEGIKQIPLAAKFYDRVKDLLQPDADVTLSIQHTIKDKTEYVDRETGEVKKHTSTGEAVTNVTRRSSRASKLDALEGVFNKYLDKYEDPNIAVGFAQAAATLLR